MIDMIEIKLKKRSLPDKLRYIADKSGNPTLAHLIRECADEVDALEAGRGVLRFEFKACCPDGREIFKLADTDCVLHFYKDDCLKFAKDLNMTAEFVEESK